MARVPSTTHSDRIVTLTTTGRLRTMLKTYNPQAVAPPFSRYSHGVESAAGARWLYISGQVGVTPEGKVAEGAAAQIEHAWRNVLSVLEAAGMGPRDLVKVTTFLIDRADLPTARTVRERMLQGAAPASTLLFVAGLASPEWLVEIEAIAAAT
jgi:enamine deaminase RidA (YjgF/YER057c/UK114 family)